MEQRLMDALAARGLRGAAAKRALASGKVALSGVPTGDAGRLVDPEKVTVNLNAPRIAVGRDPVVLWRDAHLAVLWKPAGLLSVPAPRAGGSHNLVGWVRRLFGEAHVVHRLDEDTSGVMMVARTEAAVEPLKALFAAHDVDRRYLALVAHRFPSEPRRVHSFFVRDRGDGRRGSAPKDEPVPEGAREAITHLRRVELLGADASLVEARLETGRTHQVRIHLAESGHPVLGDALYGTRGFASRSSRLALHAATLGFRNPFTGEHLHFEAPLADDLEVLRRKLLGGRRS